MLGSVVGIVPVLGPWATASSHAAARQCATVEYLSRLVLGVNGPAATASTRVGLRLKGGPCQSQEPVLDDPVGVEG